MAARGLLLVALFYLAAGRKVFSIGCFENLINISQANQFANLLTSLDETIGRKSIFDDINVRINRNSFNSKSESSGSSSSVSFSTEDRHRQRDDPLTNCPIDEGVMAGQMDDKVMEEASGLAYSKNGQNILWTQNDHGGEARVFAIAENGSRLSIVNLAGVDNDDWEDLATTIIDGVSFLLVADTGNNDHDKDPLTVYKFVEPTLDGSEEMLVVDIEKLQVRYPDFSYDCEALTVDSQTGDILMFTKDRENSLSEVFRYPAPQSETNNPFTLEHVATLPLYWITGGDISPDGNTLALTNKQEAFSYSKPTGQSWSEFLLENPEPCRLELNKEEQREAIALTEAGYWTTSECKDDPPCPLWFYAHSQ